MDSLRQRWSRLLDSHHQHPAGLLGRLVGARMARQHAPETAWTVDRLALRPGARILDLGCGTGQGLAQALGRAGSGRGLGLDRSATMARAARRTNARWIRAGQAAVVRGDLASLPLAAQAFDAIFSIHTLYFWPDPIAVFERLAGLLAPGGALMVVCSTGAQRPDGAWQMTPLHARIEHELLPRLRQFPATAVAFEPGPPSRQYNNWALVLQRTRTPD